MASPRFVAPPQSKDYASQFLAIHEEGFRRKMVAAERAADEKYARDTAEYQARLTAALAESKAADAELAAARKAVLDVEIKDAQGAAAAARSIASMNRTAANAKMQAQLLAAAVGRNRPNVPDWVRTDVSEDKLANDIDSLPDFGSLRPNYTDDAENPAYGDAELLDQAMAAVADAPVAPQYKPALAVAWLEQHGLSLKTVGNSKLRLGAVRELLSASPQSFDGILAELDNGREFLGQDQVNIGPILLEVQKRVDVASKDGNNPHEAADSLDRAKKKGGATSAAKAEAKADAAEDALQNADELRPDFTKARELAGERLAAAEQRAANVDFPSMDDFISNVDRIERTRQTYQNAYGGRRAAAPATRSADDDPILAAIAAVKRQSAERKAILGPKADTQEARDKMAAADQVVAEPTPENAPAPQQPGQPRPAPPPAPAAKPAHPAIPLLQEMGIYDREPERAEPIGVGNPLAQHRELLDKHGLVTRDGQVRKTRVARLAQMDRDGMMAAAALEDSGRDLGKALDRLKTDRQKAIAVGLVA